jgi:hypothetical protein
MIFGVDGTGPYGNKAYASAMKGSFVAQLCSPSTPNVKWYWRGPDQLDTYGRGPSPESVADVIRQYVTPRSQGKVYLTGYSRGGATVLDAAVILKDHDIPVEAIFLFDAVTRSPWLRGDVVPENVRYCYHAMRNPEAGSRNSFGNSPAKPADGVTYEDERFWTTHGGMGGAPWGPDGLVKPAATCSPASAWQPPIAPGMGPAIQTPQQIAEEMVCRDPKRYADKIYEGIPDWNFTNVTVEQERLGMDTVRLWMWDRLTHHGVVNSGPAREGPLRPKDTGDGFKARM